MNGGSYLSISSVNAISSAHIEIVIQRFHHPIMCVHSGRLFIVCAAIRVIYEAIAPRVIRIGYDIVINRKRRSLLGRIQLVMLIINRVIAVIIGSSRAAGVVLQPISAALRYRANTYDATVLTLPDSVTLQIVVMPDDGTIVRVEVAPGLR